MPKDSAPKPRSRLPFVAAAAVLTLHAGGTALTGLRFGPLFVLALSSVLAAGLWVAVRAGRDGPLPTGVRWALLVVWLVPPLLLWMLVGWEALFASPQEPIEGSPWLFTRVEPRDGGAKRLLH